MEMMLPVDLSKSPLLIHHRQKVLLVGSCFTEHIGQALKALKFDVLQNPHGILFDPASVGSSLISYVQPHPYTGADLFQLNEVWHSWQHHSSFSGTDKNKVLQTIQASQARAHHFLKQADWLIITLGSAFSYRLIENNFFPVANCHRAPAQKFQKYFMLADEIIAKMDNAIHQLFHFNRALNIVFTISPVRHIRDGVVNNNRSKARLIEAVHHLVNKFDRLFYFPAYELVIDGLRDYRFYAEDLVHPNYMATAFVVENFLKTFMSDETNAVISEIKKINTARKHQPLYPATEAHKQFLAASLLKVKNLQQQHPFLNFEEEIRYFSR